MTYRGMRFLLAAVPVLACGALQVHALPRVAIAAAAASSLADPRYTDPQTQIMATGLFGAVDILNVTTATPTLNELQGYDAVITWSNVNYADATALGNVFADYVDSGGGVVVAVFANSTTTAARYLHGRWETGGYEVVVSHGGTTSSAASLGTVPDPGHPIMAGVSAFSASLASRPTTTDITAGSTKVALWNDGRTLAAVGANPHRADLGFYPPSSNVTASYWNPATSDGGRLMANALLYTIPEPTTALLLGLGVLLVQRRR